MNTILTKIDVLSYCLLNDLFINLIEKLSFLQVTGDVLYDAIF